MGTSSLDFNNEINFSENEFIIGYHIFRQQKNEITKKPEAAFQCGFSLGVRLMMESMSISID